MQNTSWNEIAFLSENGFASDFFSVGDEKTENVNGQNITLQIWDFNHDQLPSGGYVGITFGMKGVLAGAMLMDRSGLNNGSFVGTELFEYINGTVYNGMPADLKKVIKAVSKKTSVGASESIRTDNMAVWLPSMNELFGALNVVGIPEGEGTQYPIFTDNASRIKSSGWWSRSPCTMDRGYWCGVTNTGTHKSTYEITDYLSVCFGFCI